MRQDLRSGKFRFHVRVIKDGKIPEEISG